MFVPFGAREAGCFREVAALYSDHLRQVALYLVAAIHNLVQGLHPMSTRGDKMCVLNSCLTEEHTHLDMSLIITTQCC